MEKMPDKARVPYPFSPDSRYKGDSVKLKWVPGEYKNGEAMELAKRISSNI